MNFTVQPETPSFYLGAAKTSAENTLENSLLELVTSITETAGGGS